MKRQGPSSHAADRSCRVEYGKRDRSCRCTSRTCLEDSQQGALGLARGLGPTGSAGPRAITGLAGAHLWNRRVRCAENAGPGGQRIGHERSRRIAHTASLVAPGCPDRRHDDRRRSRVPEYVGSRWHDFVARRSDAIHPWAGRLPAGSRGRQAREREPRCGLQSDDTDARVHTSSRPAGGVWGAPASALRGRPRH